jgi:hypothetical protein
VRRRKPRLNAINRDLTQAANLLERAAAKLRDADIAPGRNIRRIAEALGCISNIQFEIYAAQPGMLPDFLVATKFGAKVLSDRRPDRRTRRPRS